MKKILITILSGIILLFVIGNFNSNLSADSNLPSNVVLKEDNRPETHYEAALRVLNDLEIPNSDAVTDNLYLPRNSKEAGLESLEMVWVSNDINTVNAKGHVTRPITGNIDVTLSVELRFMSTVLRKDFNVTVLAVPVSDLSKVNEQADSFVLYDEDEINVNEIVLPRITHQNGAYVTWETSDSNILSLDGLVHRTEVEQTVTLTATFTLNEATTKRDYQLKIGSTKEDSVLNITADDSRILKSVSVSSRDELLSACNNAVAGTAVILEDGVYSDVPLILEQSGTEENPIFIMARNAGMVTISGYSAIQVLADHVIIANLQFLNGSPALDTGVLNLKGDSDRITNCYIHDFNKKGEDYKWVSLTGTHHEIDHCTFDYKTSGGALLTIWRNDNSSQHHYIHDNIISNFINTGGENGYEATRIGTSDNSQSDSYITIANNLYYNDCGEIEIISIKACRTIVTGNTFKACAGMVTCRHGQNNVVENNSFLCDNVKSSGGVRMYDGGHVIRNNYIENADPASNTRAGIVIHMGVNEVGTIATMNLQWTPFNVLIENNTFYNSDESILFGGKYQVVSSDVHIEGNLIVTSLECVRYDKLHDNVTFADNHFYGSAYSDESGALKDVTVPTGVEFSTTIPTLVENSEGIYLSDIYGAKNIIVITEAKAGVLFSVESIFPEDSLVA